MQTYDVVKEEVSIYDLFDISNPKVSYLTRAKPCQIACPIHGKDAHPSARVYPDTNTFRCFTCSKSWNVVTYWADVNGWRTESGTLDIGRSIKDLCLRFNISDNSFDWERRFHALQRQHVSDEVEVGPEDKYKLLAYYSWNISKLVNSLSKESRADYRRSVLNLWDDLDAISMDTESWQGDLINWYQSAKVILHDTKL